MHHRRNNRPSFRTARSIVKSDADAEDAAATVGLPGIALAALVLFLVVSTGGVILNLNYHWNQLPLPKRLVVVHAVAAVAGFVPRLAATWATRTAV